MGGTPMNSLRTRESAQRKSKEGGREGGSWGEIQTAGCCGPGGGAGRRSPCKALTGAGVGLQQEGWGAGGSDPRGEKENMRGSRPGREERGGGCVGQRVVGGSFPTEGPARSPTRGPAQTQLPPQQSLVYSNQINLAVVKFIM